ncbi:MAG: hypothetical protein JW863_07990, partial [Chitinispirillaceae bacterium]|nr:hypothetical protein [Chitinispirillaceae bacterium]
MLKRVACLLLLGLPPCTLFSQDAYWCDEFSLPDTEAAEAAGIDSSGLEIASSLSLYQTFKTRNRLDWERRFPWGTFEQSVEYQLLQLSPKSRIHSIDFSGNIIHSNFLIDGLDAGFDWTPIVSYSRDSTGTMQSSIDIGPVIHHELFAVPYSLRGGLYAYSWNNAISSLSSAPLRDYRGYPGLFAGCTIGDPLHPVASIPLWLSVDVLGRSINRNNIGLLSASALYADDIPVFGGGDSLFLHAGDSITNGKELYIGEFEGKSFFSNTSWRINHSFSGSGGVKLKERLGIRALLYYQYYLHSIAYPSKSQALDDIRTTGQKLGLGVNTREESPLSYNGGIEFVWEFEDWLYRHRFGSEESVHSLVIRDPNGKPVDTVTNRDSLIVNQSDHHSDIARMSHKVQLRLPWGIKSVYSFDAFRDSKTYPFFYRDPTGTSPSDTIWNRNENDRVQIDHRLSLRYDHRDSLFFIETYGSYRILYQYYYRAQRSADSKRTEEYRLGLDVG